MICVKGRYFDEGYLSSTPLSEVLKRYSQAKYKGISIDGVKEAWKLANPPKEAKAIEVDQVEKPKRKKKNEDIEEN